MEDLELGHIDGRRLAELMSPLFGDAPRFIERLTDARPFRSWAEFFGRAESIALTMPEPEQLELIDAHPRIGAPPGSVSALSFVEQGYAQERAQASAEAERQRVQEDLDRLNLAYEEHFGFRYVIFVAGRPRAAIVPLMEEALGEERESERRRALRDVVAIARHRAIQTGLMAQHDGTGGNHMRLETHYGKAEVSTYRTGAAPLAGIAAIPESEFVDRPGNVLAAEIDVQVMGEAFTAAYTEGDNTNVVATDTMKNFIHRESLGFTGSTLEGWLYFLGGRFLETYPPMERLRVSAEEIRFDAARVPAAGGGFEDSTVLFHRRHDDRSVASLEMARTADGELVLGDLRAGRVGLDLMKTTGSAFAAFPRDEYTTLPDRPDRLLFTHVDIAWRYDDPHVAIRPEPARYVASEQVADLAAVVFHQFVSLSIQHLVHEIGGRMFERYGALTEISFEAQNRTFDLAEESASEERRKVYTDPRPPYGRIGLTMHRD